MVLKCILIFCENEHGNGNQCFPPVEELNSWNIVEQAQPTVSAVRRLAKTKGWGRVNGADYCPGCMESL